MPRDTNGVALIPPGTKGQPNTTIQSAPYNAMLDDVYNMISESLPRDGRAGMYGDLSMGDNRIVGMADGQEPTDAVTVAQAVFIGQQILLPCNQNPYPNLVVPSGQSLLRSDYPKLWAFAQASGNLAANQNNKTDAQFGPGNGSTTFTLPNWLGYFFRAHNGTESGPDAGRGIGVVQASQNLAHNHAGNTGSAGSHSHTGTAASAGGHSHSGSALSNGNHSHSGTTGSAGNHSHSLPTRNSTGSSSSGVRGGTGGADSPHNTGTAGAHTHSFTTNTTGAHSHTLSVDEAGAHTHSVSTNTTGAHTHTIASDGGSEARPTNIALLACMRAA